MFRFFFRQGSFREHAALLARIGVQAVEVRHPRQLIGLQGLVLPGGESTAIANCVQRCGLVGQENWNQHEDLLALTTSVLMYLIDVPCVIMNRE